MENANNHPLIRSDEAINIFAFAWPAEDRHCVTAKDAVANTVFCKETREYYDSII
jgi:hypothetical protein